MFHVMISVMLTMLAVGTATSLEGEDCSVEDAARADVSLELLAALADAGASHVPLAIKPTSYGGLGVFTAAAVPKGAVVMALSSSLMLTSEGRPASLPLALAKERRNSSSAIMQLYLSSLPSTCPNNLALRGPADLALAAASLHGWKVDLLEDERRELLAHPPSRGAAWSAEDIEWATCMKMSRAFAGNGQGPVMMPFIDLINHEGDTPTCSEHGRLVNADTGEWVAEVRALRDLRQGEEVTYSYSDSPSKARMLTSFGFEAGAPSASLAAAELPQRGAWQLAQHGCTSLPRTDLRIEEPTGMLTSAALREAVRCIRVRLYEEEEAAWVARSGHLDADWGGSEDVEGLASGHHAEGGGEGEEGAVPMLSAILQKDMAVAEKTGAMCSSALASERLEEQPRRLAAASTDLRNAIREETEALNACAEGFAIASERIAARGWQLFGGGHS
jgi:hypothetical protein